MLLMPRKVSRLPLLPATDAQREKAVHAAVIAHRKAGRPVERIGRRLWNLAGRRVGTSRMVALSGVPSSPAQAGETPSRPGWWAAGGEGP
jgi:hypothetical protein